jgi:hypothetical protein
MKKLYLTLLILAFTSASYAGCMSDKIKAVNEKLKMSSVSETVKNEATKLRDLGIENEHSNAQLATKYFEDALSLLN